jgi:hypothetical protein
MHSHEIPNAEWVPFFDEVSKRHHGEHVTVELIGRKIAGRGFRRDESLMDITVDPPTGACKIQVMLGGSITTNMAHEIAHPIHVRLSQSDDGKDAAIEIEADDGPCAVVRFDA